MLLRCATNGWVFPSRHVSMKLLSGLDKIFAFRVNECFAKNGVVDGAFAFNLTIQGLLYLPRKRALTFQRRYIDDIATP